MYENFVRTKETVRVREVSVLEGYLYREVRQYRTNVYPKGVNTRKHDRLAAEEVGCHEWEVNKRWAIWYFCFSVFICIQEPCPSVRDEKWYHSFLRPVSLLNVDCKILTKVLTKRLEKIINPENYKPQSNRLRERPAILVRVWSSFGTSFFIQNVRISQEFSKGLWLSRMWVLKSCPESV